MRLRLPVLPVRQAPRQPCPTGRGPGRVGAVRRLGGRAGGRPAVAAVHPVGRGAGALLVPACARGAEPVAAHPPGGDPDQPQLPHRLAGRGRRGHARAVVHVPPGADAVRPLPRQVPRPGRPRHSAQRGRGGPARAPGPGPPAARGPARAGVPVGQRRRGAHLHRRRGGPVDGPRPAVPVQPPPAPQRGSAVPHRGVRRLGGRGGHGAPLPFRPRGAGQPLRRLLPAGPAPACLPARGLRLPHRLRPSGDAAAVRRVRGRGAGADTGRGAAGSPLTRAAVEAAAALEGHRDRREPGRHARVRFRPLPRRRGTRCRPGLAVGAVRPGRFTAHGTGPDRRAGGISAPEDGLRGTICRSRRRVQLCEVASHARWPPASLRASWRAARP
ncbi:hypothetical protein SGPA1_21648 [Streptomyces misionensis JCM 4497]